jgi:uncharacterized iron-regulated protein
MFPLRAVFAVALAAASGSAAAAPACVAPGRWAAPGAPAVSLEEPALLRSLSARRVVLLGEAHDSAEHHRWQLQTMAALHALHPDMVVGFEAFPRRVQPALDRWTAGTLSEKEFLAASDWRNVWGMDPELYLPLFHFARMNRIPMLALNVERRLAAAVREKGFDAIEPARREGVTKPAAPAQKYVDFLFPIFAEHEKERPGSTKPARDSVEFRHFLEGQTLWDRAMAQALADAAAKRPGALVVGVMGRHHAAHRYGVPHQLADLGVRDAAVLLPWGEDESCAELVAGIADAVFGVAPAKSEAARPRLGVRLERADGAVRIASVVKASVAEAAGLKAGDLVLEIAGQPAKQAGDVVSAVGRQPPGTWLPLRVKRGDATLDLVAKFPPLAN